MFLLDGKPLALDRAFTHAGIQYPSNWLRLATPQERAAIGITEAPEPPSWDQRFYWGYDDQGALIPKDLEELRTLWSSTTRATANTLLAPTDWLITREADTGTPCPPEIRAWRQSIRDAAARKVSVIEACLETSGLAEYLTSGGVAVVDPESGEVSIDSSNAYGNWPEVPPIETASHDCDYRSFYDALLVSAAYATIREKATSSSTVLTACVEFIAAIGDAKAGRPNPAAIQACVDLLCAAAQFTEAELAALADVMQVGGLDQVYTLPTG